MDYTQVLNDISSKLSTIITSLGSIEDLQNLLTSLYTIVVIFFVLIVIRGE